MPSVNPIAEGAKSLSEGLNQAREAGKGLTKTIEDIQRDGKDVAKKDLEDHQRQRIHAEAMENSVIYRAIQEYKNQSEIIQAENKAEKDFKDKYGEKEWAKVLELKVVVERERKENQTHYGHKLKDVQRVQMYCWIAAFIVTCLLYYFHLV